MNRIEFYIFTNILKSCLLVFFIFISISWLLQLTRLFTLSNFIQIDILSIIYLSLFLIPNLISVILHSFDIWYFAMFLKLYKDREIIAIFSLGLKLKSIKYSLLFFTIFIVFINLLISFYLSPRIYEEYKIREFELRNTINFDKMILSNFLKINKNTTIDFKKNNNLYEDIFINYIDEKENLIFAKKGIIKNINNKFVFQLNEGFKLSINENDEIEKLEFVDYILKIDNERNNQFNNYDSNTLTIFDDIKTKNYRNIFYKIIDTLIILFIVLAYYYNNILGVKFDIKNNIFFVFLSIALLIVNQFFKNSELDLNNYLILIFIFIFLLSSILIIKRKYD